MIKCLMITKVHPLHTHKHTSGIWYGSFQHTHKKNTLVVYNK